MDNDRQRWMDLPTEERNLVGVVGEEWQQILEPKILWTV